MLKEITEIEGLDHLEPLENSRIIGCKSVENLLDLSNFKSLKSLYVEDCEKIRDPEIHQRS